MDRVTVEQAAHILGIKEESVRKRVSRGTLRAGKDEDGRLRVYVDDAKTVRDEYTDGSAPHESTALISELKAHNATLQAQLEQANERDKENRRIIAALTSRIPAIEAPPEAPESPGPMEITSEASEDALAPTQRAWWQRVFGG